MPESTPTPFVDALLRSPTFHEHLLHWGLPVLALLGLALWLTRAVLRRGEQRRSLHADERGVAAAVDFTLTLPLFLALVSLIVQFGSLLSSSMIVHYAAYTAARSARVHAWEQAWPLPPFPIAPGQSRAAPRAVVQRADRAARYVLIAASPAEPELLPDQAQWANGARSAQPYLEALARSSDIAESDRAANALAVQAGYAFYPRNASVSIELFSAGLPRVEANPLPQLVQDPPGVTAIVEFHLYTGALYGYLLGDERDDGVRTTVVTAEVRLL